MRTRSHIGVMLVATLVLSLGWVGTAYAAPGDYGAIAYSPSTKVASFGAGGDQAAAENAAVDGCTSQGGASDCTTYLWFENGYGALARSGEQFGTGWGTNAGNADKYAIQICRDHGGTNCAVVYRAQTSDTADESPDAHGGTASQGPGSSRNPNAQQPAPDLSGPAEEPPSAILTPGNREVPQWLQNAGYCGLDIGFRVGWIAKAAKASGVGAQDAQFLGYVHENGDWLAVLWDASAKDYWSIPLEFVPYNSCVKLAANALFPNGIGELQPPGPGQPIPVPVGTPTRPK